MFSGAQPSIAGNLGALSTAGRPIFCAVWARAALAATLICVVADVANVEIWQRGRVCQVIEAKCAVVKFTGALVGKATQQSKGLLSGDHVVVDDYFRVASLSIKRELISGSPCTRINDLKSIWQIFDLEALGTHRPNIFGSNTAIPFFVGVQFFGEARKEVCGGLSSSILIRYRALDGLIFLNRTDGGGKRADPGPSATSGDLCGFITSTRLFIARQFHAEIERTRRYREGRLRGEMP
jgi:hypothetical protein